jgi:hypothetical protein
MEGDIQFNCPSQPPLKKWWTPAGDEKPVFVVKTLPTYIAFVANILHAQKNNSPSTQLLAFTIKRLALEDLNQRFGQ